MIAMKIIELKNNKMYQEMVFVKKNKKKIKLLLNSKKKFKIIDTSFYEYIYIGKWYEFNTKNFMFKHYQY